MERIGSVDLKPFETTHLYLSGLSVERATCPNADIHLAVYEPLNLEPRETTHLYLSGLSANMMFRVHHAYINFNIL